MGVLSRQGKILSTFAISLRGDLSLPASASVLSFFSAPSHRMQLLFFCAHAASFFAVLRPSLFFPHILNPKVGARSLLPRNIAQLAPLPFCSNGADFMTAVPFSHNSFDGAPFGNRGAWVAPLAKIHPPRR